MKHVLFLLVGIIAVHLSAQAQSGRSQAEVQSLAEPLRLSPQLGYSSFALKTESYEVGPKEAMTVGINSYFGIMPAVDLETGLHYMTMGGRQQGKILGQDISNTLTFSYFAVPVNIRYKFLQLNAPGNPNLYIKGGVVLALLNSAVQDITVNSFSVTKDIKQDTKNFDLLPSVSLGSSYELGNHQDLLLDLTYMRGTQKILSEYQAVNEGFLAAISYSLAI